ncbi:hypothetical protein GCM10009430_40110 [Aquimarina litoralis]|uniref:SGNH/GDSL hydrolase family protein n=1 Tax=Aquimarina litoralis TaxID=584605 RepID=A0ABN1J5T7_9FLAO
MKKSLIRVFIKFGTISFFTIILWEVVLGIYVHKTDIKIEVPIYSLQNTQGFWFDLNEDFGTIHLPDHFYRQKKICFDVLYESNSSGFRDKERKVKSLDKRVVVLGDSFMEGVGVQVNERVSDLLEIDTKVPHLNYGMAGNFGPTQYYMLYKTLASTYSHEAILIGILPSNDFIDDDYEISLRVGGNRYRPFFDGEYPNYKLVYHANSMNKSSAKPKKHNKLKVFLKNFTYSYNMLAYVKAKRRIKAIPKDSLLSPEEVPSYFSYSPKQINRMKYALEQIKLIAGDKPVMVFTIPIFQEIKAYRKHGENPLGKELSVFCHDLGIEYLDLLPETDKLSIEQCEEQFLSCDGHWSALGNSFAKEKIQQYFKYYQ